MALVNCPDSVKPELMVLLNSIMGNSDYAQFSLAGGTALALRFGHRTSVDIDLFSIVPFDSLVLQSRLAADFPGMQIENRTQGSLCASIDGIKLDFLHHAFPYLEPLEIENSLRLVSLCDAAAMKINAVTNRGSKKDFIDLYALVLHGITLTDAVTYFCRKYKGNRFLAIRSLLWFAEADQEPDPVFLNDWTWYLVREKIQALADILAE